MCFSSSSSCFREEDDKVVPCKGGLAAPVGTDPGYLPGGHGLSVPTGHLHQGFNFLPCCSLVRTNLGGSEGLPHITVKHNQLGGCWQPPPKPPMPASPYLAPPWQLPHHLAHCLPRHEIIHQLLELLVALEELPHLLADVRAADGARCLLLPCARHHRPRLAQLQEGEKESALR